MADSIFTQMGSVIKTELDTIQTGVDTKLDTSSYTAADVLTKIKTVDGAGSGLDADLLDGKSSNQFALVTDLDGAGGLVAPEGKGMWGSIMTHSDRANGYSYNWSSGRAWTTYYSYQAYSMNSYSQLMAAAFADGYGPSGSSQQQHLGDTNDSFFRRLVFAAGNRLGRASEQFHYSNNTSYSGETVQIIPVKNPTGSNINTTVYWGYSSRWSSGYDGANMFVVTPNSTTAANVTNVTTTNRWSYTGSGNSTNSSSITVPANTTVLLVLVTTDQYHTTYRFTNHNWFYNLTTMDSVGLECDMKVLSAMAKSRLNIGYTSSNAGYTIWTKAASDFGA